MNSPLPTPTQCEVDQLIALYNAGHYPELESQAKLLVERYPESGRAWKILGTALGVQGKNALAAMQHAALLLPDDASVLNNLGNALQGQGQYEAAAASFRKALEIEPEFADAHNNLGNALKHLQQFNEAVHSYRRALVLRPNYSDASFNLGNALQSLGQFEDAVASYRNGLMHDPNDEPMHFQLGVVLQYIGRLEESVASYRRAIAINSKASAAYNNLGNVLQDLKRTDEAVTAYAQALINDPGFVEVHINLGNAFREMRRLGDAVASYNKALALNPDSAGAYGNLGNALHDRGDLDDALASYRRAFELEPEYAEAHNSEGAVLLELRQFDVALASFRRALQVDSDFSTARSNLLFALNSTQRETNKSCLDEAKTYGEMVAKRAPARFSEWTCTAKPERLRVGLVSGDLCKHPVGYALENFLLHIDSKRIELFAYPTNPKVDELTKRIQLHFAGWKPIYGKSDADAAKLIHEDGVHILLDLSGHTTHNRLPLFAWKPAPVQASWLGYFATTGVSEMDYLLTSEVAVPEAHHRHFTERIRYLPDIWLCFTPPEQEIAISKLPALQNGHVTFGCFQRMDKISDAALDAWGTILARLPEACLSLANKQLGSSMLAEHFRGRLQQHGLDPARVSLIGAAETRGDYFARYTEIDVMLDSFPYPGVTTTCEALWMGVPTLTLAGDTLLSRQGAGMLVPTGLGEWVAGSEAEYIEKAAQLTSDLPKLDALRAGLRQQVLASPVYDALRFARNFETALWGMWREKP